MEQKPRKKITEPPKESRRTYTRPELINFGSIRNLTTGGSIGMMENGLGRDRRP